MDRFVYINGQFVAADNAVISVFDRGFLFGDSVYEVIPVHAGKIYYLSQHIARLNNSLDSADIAHPVIDWETIGNELVLKNGGGDLQLYFQITRGNQHSRQYDVLEPLTPSVIAFTIHTPYPTLEKKQQGLHAFLTEDLRWLRCDIKTTSLIGNVMLNNEAISQGFGTTLLLRDNFVTEGASSNVFVVTAEDKILTPPECHLCLPGITRRRVISLLNACQINVFEEPIHKDQLTTAKEVWITSTTKGAYPITRINHSPVGNGQAGPLWHQIEHRYQQFILEDNP
jgi:D-alanine transaminase